MTVTFFGHSSLSKCMNYEKQLLNFLSENIADKAAEIYLGDYGDFDNFAYTCCKKYKETHPRVTLCFITPYLTLSYQRNHLKFQQHRYDEIIYPPLESIPTKFAIVHRNRWMIEKADILICAVKRKQGNAYKLYQYAKRLEKPIFNLARDELSLYGDV